MDILKKPLLIAVAVIALITTACAYAQGGASTGAAAPTHQQRQAVDTPVPILLYHHIATAPKHTKDPAIYVPAATFKKQIAALANAGYVGVTLDQVWRAWQGDGTLPAKPLVLSFDDGYASQYRTALPALRARGWKGVLNLIVHNPYPEKMSSSQVRSMIGAGWELDAHTLTHPDLTKISKARMISEVAASRTDLQRLYGVDVDFLAYPYGHVNAAVEAAVQDAGYLGATTTKAGIASPNSDPDRLPRIIVSPHTTPQQLLAKLRG